MKLWTSIFLLFGLSLFASSVRILNDSPFPLTAEILAADGRSKGKITVRPQADATWQDTDSGAYTWSQTPYQVIFTCKSGKQYGVVDGVQQGGLVRASNAEGTRDCTQPKKNEAQGQTPAKSGDSDWGPPEGTTPSSPNSRSTGEAPDQSSSEPPNDSIWGPP